jgi:hypothetical protein
MQSIDQRLIGVMVDNPIANRDNARCGRDRAEIIDALDGGRGPDACSTSRCAPAPMAISSVHEPTA